MSKYAMLPYRNTNNMMRFFDDFDRGFFAPLSACASFSTDISDEGDHYLLEAELPGFDKGDINVSVEGDQLVIHAAHEQETEDKKKNYLHRERSFGSYTRRFDINGIDVAAISAKYDNGVLALTLPKQPEKQPEGRKISVT